MIGGATRYSVIALSIQPAVMMELKAIYVLY